MSLLLWLEPCTNWARALTHVMIVLLDVLTVLRAVALFMGFAGDDAGSPAAKVPR